MLSRDVMLEVKLTPISDDVAAVVERVAARTYGPHANIDGLESRVHLIVSPQVINPTELDTVVQRLQAVEGVRVRDLDIVGATIDERLTIDEYRRTRFGVDPAKS